MDGLIGRVSYPVFLHSLWIFFLIASVFAFFVGLGLALRSVRMLRICAFMNRWVSVRRMTKPLYVPHYVEPVLLKRPTILGMLVIGGASISVYLLSRGGFDAIYPSYKTLLPYTSTVILAGAVRNVLLTGNALCIVVGVMLLFSPQKFTRIERYTDAWYSIRKHTLPLDKMHSEVDQWVLAHPTVSGAALMMMSLGLGVAMLGRI